MSNKSEKLKLLKLDLLTPCGGNWEPTKVCPCCVERVLEAAYLLGWRDRGEGLDILEADVRKKISALGAGPKLDSEFDHGR